jgi:hypothetical protein
MSGSLCGRLLNTVFLDKMSSLIAYNTKMLTCDQEVTDGAGKKSSITKEQKNRRQSRLIVS